jgi:hypothetical protein
MKLEDNVFKDLLASARGAPCVPQLGSSWAAAYRLAASRELPARRLTGPVYVVTAGLRWPAS